MSERFAASGGYFVSQIRRDDFDTLSEKDANCRMAHILQNEQHIGVFTGPQF